MTAQDFIFKAAPYKKVEHDEYQELYADLSKKNLSVNGYNPIRRVETTYHLCSNNVSIGRGQWGPSGFEPVDDNVRVLSFRCGRHGDILTVLVYKDVKAEYLMKIGCYPSLRDFHKDDIRKYDKVLSEQQKTELITAIMIANNGVGIGSYVYLRRIFEGIVFEEAQRAINAGVITQEEFDRKRMDEKIVAIKDFLPGFLYDNHKALYGILSMGIHQLDEEDCLSFFPVMYDCITLILEDRLAQREREITTKNAAASLSRIATILGKTTEIK